MSRWRRILGTTAVRLTLVYTLLFGILAVGMVFYVSYNTGQLLLSQFRASVDEEVNSLSREYRRGGIRRLMPILELRARSPGANLYLVADGQGRIVAGNVRDMDRSLLIDDGWRIPPFQYLRFEGDGSVRHRAVARVFILPGGLRLLVGRDIGDAESFRTIVLRATAISLGVMMLTGLLLWFFVGRRALKHMDSVSQSSARIMAGDLSQRLPLSGAGDEFDRLSANLNALIERVEKLNTGLVSMSDSIAHDLKTPLTRLRNRAEAALSQRENERAAQTLQAVVDDADGLIRTFNALLMISQVEAGGRSVQLEAVDPDAVVRAVHELFEPSSEELGARLTLNNGPAGPIKANRELLAQAITNLLDNALKYGLDAPDPEITLDLYREGQNAVIAVRDNGAGIPEGQREEVLKRFTRLDDSRTKPGSGLGLSLVQAVVKLHDGDLTLRDNGPGLSVEMRFPLEL